MSDATTRIRLPFLAPAQAQKHVTVNEAFLRLDALTQCAVLSHSIAAQPSSPSDGDLYIVPASASGDAWEGFTAGSLAYWRDGVWEEIAPGAGWVARVLDSGEQAVFDGVAWSSVAAGANDLLINGRFDIWQRGTSFTCGASVIYGADRWAAKRASFAAGLTVSQQTGPTGARYALRAQRDSGNSSTAVIELSQTLETADALALAGDYVTLRFRIRTGANFSGAHVRAAIVTGTGTDEAHYAGLTSATEADGEDIAPGSTWANGVVVAAIPSSATQIAVVFSVTPSGTADANDWFEIADVGLARGAHAPLPQRRRIGDETALCQRYFQKSYNVDVAPGAATLAGCVAMTAHASTSYLGLGHISFPVSMRTTPTVTLYNPSSGSTTNPMRNTNAGANLPGAISAQGAGGFCAIVDLASVSAAETVCTHFVASAEL